MTSLSRISHVVLLLALTFLGQPAYSGSGASDLNSSNASDFALSLSYSRDPKICEAATQLLRENSTCRAFEADQCGDDEAQILTIGGKGFRTIEELADNEYGYTQISRAPEASAEGFAIVYTDEFQGDRNPRLIETWKVSASALEDVLRRPPGPIKQDKWVPHEKATNQAEFHALLMNGEKISEEWSPTVLLSGHTYALERECSGHWQFGGYYWCDEVMKMTVKRLSLSEPAEPYCKFTVPKKKNRRTAAPQP